jgi:UDP-N-acetylglucosamine 2-epimerase (non-hydrolysing)
MTGPIAVVFETQQDFTALSGVIAELGPRCRTVQVLRPESRRRTRGFFDGDRLVETDVQVGPIEDGQDLEALSQFTAAFDDLRPGAILVHGDSDGAALAARAAASASIPVGRLDVGEAEERTSHQFLNHHLICALATVHFVPSEVDARRLAEDGVAPNGIVTVGDLTSETTLRLLPSADERREILAVAGLDGNHVVAAINQPENVDDPARLRFILRALSTQHQTVAMPLNPHVARRIREFDLVDEARALTNLKVVDRSTFLTFIQAGSLVVTDVGAVLREAATLKVPALLVAAQDPAPSAPEWIADPRFAHRVTAGPMLSAHLRAALDDPTWSARLSDLPNPAGDGLASQRVAWGIAGLVVARAAKRSNEGLTAGSGP